jgi:hypothetical protein
MADSFIPRDQVLVIDNTPAPVIFVFSLAGTMLRSMVLDPAFSTKKHFVRINALAIDPSNAHIWYVASNSMGLLRSVDNGETWMGFTCPVVPPQSGNIHSLQFTAGAAPKLVLCANGQAVVIDDHEHGAALFPVPFSQVVERMQIYDP